MAVDSQRMTRSMNAAMNRNTTGDTLHTQTPSRTNTATDTNTAVPRTNSTQNPTGVQNDSLKCIQINLHGRSRATDSLASLTEARNHQVILLQDFHQNKKQGTSQGSIQKKWNITKTKRSRSAIITKLGTKPMTILAKEFTTAITLENKDNKFTIINAYASTPPPTADFSTVLTEIEEVLKKAVGEVLLTGGFNAHSTTGGYEDIDQRGKELADFLLYTPCSSTIQRMPNPHSEFHGEDLTGCGGNSGVGRI